MNRQIKFRAWVEEERRYQHGMHDWQDIINTIDLECGYRKSLFHLGNDSSVENVILMQYTGLKDKNGKEEYHNDLVRYEGKSFRGKDQGFIAEIKWDDEQANFYLELKKHWGDFNPASSSLKNRMAIHVWNKDLEIIGNIYENPELLKND